MPIDGMHTVSEAAEQLDLSVAQVLRRIHAGHLKAVQFTSPKLHYLVGADAIAEYRGGNGETNNDAWRPMLTVAQVAQITGFTPDTIRLMCLEGRFEYVRGRGTRGQYRISRDSLERYMSATADIFQ